MIVGASCGACSTSRSQPAHHQSARGSMARHRCTSLLHIPAAYPRCSSQPTKPCGRASRSSALFIGRGRTRARYRRACAPPPSEGSSASTSIARSCGKRSPARRMASSTASLAEMGEVPSHAVRSMGCFMAGAPTMCTMGCALGSLQSLSSDRAKRPNSRHIRISGCFERLALTGEARSPENGSAVACTHPARGHWLPARTRSSGCGRRRESAALRARATPTP